MTAPKQLHRSYAKRRPARREEGNTGLGGSAPAVPQGCKLFAPRAWTALSRSLQLSQREQQLLHGVLNDWTDAAIAANLGISRHTVHTHFERLHHKLGVTNRPRLIVRVVAEFLALTASPGSGLPPICPNCDRCGCPLRHRPAAP